ncbi:OmpA family protein [Pontibacter roseus]|uniref:OmpA family protein n=1 Tax=Pontibacter roseus TaxID=336989 RepID=UPI00036AEB47|nr:OmpA family protein [Pontibacter roseus]
MHPSLPLKPLAHCLQSTGIFLLLLFVLGSCGAGLYLGKGDKRFQEEQYERAIEFYKQALGKEGNSGEVNYKIAEAYRLSNRLAQAEPFYKAALDNNFRKEEAYFHYGMALKANSKYEAALGQMQDYARIGSNPRLKGLAQKEVEVLSQLSMILKKNSGFALQNLEVLNTEGSEFAPYVLNNELIFSSTRGPGKEYLGNGEGFLNIFATTLGDSATMGGAVRQLEGVNVEGIHDAMATFTDEGNTMVFARGNEGTKKGRQNVDLYVSFYRSNAWTEPKLLNINDPRAWDSSPAISPDGKTLYFASDRKGGLGGNDIYKSAIDDNGRFLAPENLGPDINTPGNESYVYVGPDGTLYVASDGLPGLGGMDLFRIEDGKPVNMGTPVNSSGDDFGIFFQDDYSGYLSSNREGGKGGDDIYAISKSRRKLVNFFVDGTVYQRRDKDKQQTVVPNITVVLQNEQGQKLAEAKADAEGKFSFPLDSASAYSLLSEKEGFFAARQRITTVGKMPPQNQLPNDVNEVRLTANLVLNEIVKEKAIVLENIFYDFDKANIRPDAAAELDKLVEILVDNPRISIELSSHTDSRGVDIYNQDLSQRRAQSAVNYIISKGIDRSRITAKGYGESRPVVRNAKTEEQHQRNRRTEFKVVRVQE